MNKHIKLSISPIGWTNDDDPSLGGNIPFEQCLAEMQQAGFKGTELGSKYPKNAVELKSSLQKHDLQLSSAWFSARFTDPNQYQQSLENFFITASCLKACGAKIINICEVNNSIQQKNLPLFSNNKPCFNNIEWQRLIDGLHAIGRIALSMDMQIAYHFHLGTGVQTMAEVCYLMDNTSPELVGLLLDTGHAYAADIDPNILITNYGSRINLLHLKDIRKSVLKIVKSDNLSFMEAVRLGLFTVPGDGFIDFQPIVDQIRKLNYMGWLVVEAEQDPAKANPLQYAKKAKKYLNEVMACTM